MPAYCSSPVLELLSLSLTSLSACYTINDKEGLLFVEHIEFTIIL